jgi:hypothetical protein
MVYENLIYQIDRLVLSRVMIEKQKLKFSIQCREVKIGFSGHFEPFVDA